MKLKVTPEDVFLGSEPPHPSGFPELLTPPPVRFSNMPSVVGVWIFCGITHWTQLSLHTVMRSDGVNGIHQCDC